MCLAQFGITKNLVMKEICKKRGDDKTHEREICTQCAGLGLNLNSIFVKECLGCHGTGYKPV